VYLAGATVPFVCPSRAILSTSVDCDNAQASIAMMNSTFQSLANSSNYADSVAAVQAAFNQAWGFGIVAPGLCSTVHTIGCQADQLTNQMLVDQGQAPVTGPTAGDPGIISSLPTIPQVGGFVGVLAIAALAIVAYIHK
jgi:hypothetical protein